MHIGGETDFEIGHFLNFRRRWPWS